MSHILEVVVAAFLVGVAGSILGFLLEQKIRSRIEQHRTIGLWTVVCGLLGAAILVVILGFYLDSLTFKFAPRIISIQIPNPQASSGVRRVSIPLLLSLAAAFFLFVRSTDLSVSNTDLLGDNSDPIPRADPFAGLFNLSKTVSAVSAGILTALMFQYFKTRLYAGWVQTVPVPLPLALAGVNFIIAQYVIGFVKRRASPRSEVAVTILWSSISYVILVLAFIR